MFATEKESRSDLISAFEFYDHLLKRYYDEMIFEVSDNHLQGALSLLHTARIYILELQEKRNALINDVRREMDSWSTETLVEELNERVKHYRNFPLPVFKRKLFERDEIFDSGQHSIHYIEDFLIPVREEGRYLMEGIKQIITRLGDNCPEEHHLIRLRLAIEPSIFKETSQERLRQKREELKKQYPGKEDQHWIESVVQEALGCLAGDKGKVFFHNWCDYYWN